MDSSKMISEQLFLLIPMLYNQIIRPIEGALRAKISPLQFYALMALKREGCMTMSALSAHCGVSKQQSTRLINSLADTGLVERRPCKQDRWTSCGRRSAGELKIISPFSPRENRRSCCFPWKLFGK